VEQAGSRLIVSFLLCTAASSYAQYSAAPAPSITLPAIGEVLKGDGAGGAVVAAAGSDFATVAQAAHSGGVIGTATFKAVGGSISNLVSNGVIASVDFLERGMYSISLSSQSDSNYIVLASLGGNGTDDTWSYNIPLHDKLSERFTLEVRLKGEKSDDSDNIQIAVLRLSQ
jgi:hypothetical protein